MKTSGASPKSIFFDRTVEAMFEANAQFALREFFNMTHRYQYLVIASKIFGQGFGFGGRWDDDQRFSHYKGIRKSPDGLP
jgi:hypothetical protein